MAIVKTSSIYDSYPTPSRGKYFIHHLLLEGRNGNCLGNIDGVRGKIHSVLPPYFGFTSLKLESRLEIFKRKQSMLKKKIALKLENFLVGGQNLKAVNITISNESIFELS